MKVFVTGGTGVLGTPVVRKLIAAGHHVRAISRSKSNRDQLIAAGAEPFEADLFNPRSLRPALEGVSAILHLATRIPPPASISKPGAWAENDRIRDEGTRNLIDAALASGVTTFIYPGVVFGYPDSGSNWIDAGAPVDDLLLLESSASAEASVERFTRNGRRGIVLRMGGFYGPSAGHSRDLLHAARWGVATLFGASSAYQPLIWVEDAAGAVVAALERAPAGVYDVVDDEPLTRRDLAAALAAATGRHRLLRPPAFLLRLMAGKQFMFLTRSQRVSNSRIREATGWKPEIPSAREGLRQLVKSLGVGNEDRREHVSETATVPVFRGVSDARQRR
ncbi:MAG TPA: NAD(P)-dependent oxidoreductase [Terriglobia bacterium]|nr:NAD(P)-dependent oxidoreductase [Terriglobia bacterium]